MDHSTLWSGGRWALAVSLGCALILSACGSAAGDSAAAKVADTKKEDSAAGTAVNIANFLYEPQEITVAAGTKVTWTNQDDAPHNVQDLSELNTPISKDLNKGDTFSITYPKAGSYSYVCALHTYMTGTVKVT
jgi:plastocyanin